MWKKIWKKLDKNEQKGNASINNKFNIIFPRHIISQQYLPCHLGKHDNLHSLSPIAHTTLCKSKLGLEFSKTNTIKALSINSMYFVNNIWSAFSCIQRGVTNKKHIDQAWLKSFVFIQMLPLRNGNTNYENLRNLVWKIDHSFSLCLVQKKVGFLSLLVSWIGDILKQMIWSLTNVF